MYTDGVVRRGETRCFEAAQGADAQPFSVANCGKSIMNALLIELV